MNDYNNNQNFQQSYVAPQSPPVQQMPVGAVAPPAKKRSILPAILIIVVILIAGVVAGSFVISANDTKGYEGAVDNFVDVIIYENIDELECLMPDEVWEYLAEENDMDKDELIEELKDSAQKEEITIDEMEDFSYEITDARKLDKDKREDIGDMLEDNFDMDPDCVERAYKIKLKLEFEYETEDYDQKISAYAVRIDGEWYLLNKDGSFADF